jgi:hypothetical protein
MNITRGKVAHSWALLALLLTVAFGCGDDSTKPQPEDNDPPAIPAPTTPENVVSAIEVIYNDDVRSPRERLDAYASLLSDYSAPFEEAFIFLLTPADIESGLPPTWGLDSELAAHRAIFEAQGAGDIHSLELQIVHNPAQDLTPPEPGREGWKHVFATNVYLRLMFNVEDGLEVNGGQADFMFPPPHDGRFKIAEWRDLPRPGAFAGTSSVEGSTWGSVKAGYWLRP